MNSNLFLCRIKNAIQVLMSELSVEEIAGNHMLIRNIEIALKALSQVV